MPNSAGEPLKHPRDAVRERLRGLRALKESTQPIDSHVRRSLTDWSQTGGRRPAPNEISLRPGFVRRTRPLTEQELDGHSLIDRPKPKLPRQPPLAWLTRLPRGVGLRTALTLPYLIQTRPGTLGADGRLAIPVEAIDEPFGLLDLIAVHAVHKPPPNSTFASSPKQNRKRQIRDALTALATPELQMVTLPISGRGQHRFGDVHINREEGPYGVDEPPRYKPPRRTDAIGIPAAFFTRGWVHVMTSREIAMWLMLRDLTARAEKRDASADAAPPTMVRIQPRIRLTEYDLSLATWSSHRQLEAFGLIHVERDPNRRENGTTKDGRRADPHQFRLIDDMLGEGPAIDRVINALEDMSADD